MKALRAYHQELVDIYSFAIEVDSALMTWNSRLKEMVGSSGTTERNTLYFGESHPNDPAARAHHARTFGYLIEASKRDGDYAQQLRWSAIVRLYSVWEDRFRQEIADECGLLKNDIRGDAHGDLRTFRRAIVHAGGRLEGDPTVLRYCKRGDSLQLSSAQVVDMFRQLTAELNGLALRHYGADPGLALTGG